MQIDIVHGPPKTALLPNAPVSRVFVKQWEKLKLKLRAEKYLRKEDRGGIAYITNEIKEGDTIFDIGAHKAGYLYFFLNRLGGKGMIYAFEPQTPLYDYLLKLQRLFGWENLRIESSAVSDISGTAVLGIPYNKGHQSSPCATIVNNDFFSSAQRYQKVSTICLDDYCRKHKIIPNFLKVDVEGNELAVFKGAENILRRYRPKILFECEERFVGKQQVWETFVFLISLGYHGSFISGNERRPIEAFDLSIHQSTGGTFYCNNFIFD